MRTSSRLARLAWATLAWNFVVIVWGAYVRASGSGAGCGDHWPLCNGAVVPRAPSAETLVELTHRLTSGLAGLLVVAVAVLAWRQTRPGAPLRRMAVASVVFMVLEALIGAALVKFELVADNDSVFRAASLAVHLVNTFLLVATVALTAWYASGRPAWEPARQPRAAWAFILGAVGLVLVGTTGAVTALGDTLFPAGSLAEGIRQDFSPTAHFLVRLRVWHPVLAVAVGAAVAAQALLRAAATPDPMVRHLARTTAALVLGQWALGLTNLLLLAPIALQLLHLLLADFVWLAYVLLAAAALRAPDGTPGTAPHEPAVTGVLAAR